MEQDFRRELSDFIEENRERYLQMSDAIWDFAETHFEEVKSSALQRDYLAARGFAIRENLSEEQTAFCAEFGQGRPVIAFLGEFDALPGLSQQADCAQKHPIAGAGNGHGCGHQLLGTACLAAADALKTYLEAHDLSGTVRYYGCPAEENAGGKAFLVRDGVFSDCDAALTWHPGAQNKTKGYDQVLANFRVFFTFHGVSSHAAAAPEVGRSALDAVELMDVGVNFLREHMIDAARIHGAITNSGGSAPNVIPAEAQVLYAIRAPKVSQVQALYARVCDIAKGAALMTGTTVEQKFVAAYSDFVRCEALDELLDENLRHFVPIGYTKEELAYAARFKSANSEAGCEALKSVIADTAQGQNVSELLAQPMLDYVMPRRFVRSDGSTDVGDVSWVVPTAHMSVNCFAAATALHSWQAVAQGKSALAHKGLLTAAKVLACAGVQLLETPELAAKAKRDWLAMLGGAQYPNPLPKDAKPEVW